MTDSPRTDSHITMYASIVILIVLVAGLAFVLALLNGQKAKDMAIVQKPILTPNEMEFFYRLTRALPSYHVFPQVAFGAILQATGKNRYAARGTFSQKMADYVVCEPDTMKIVAIVELDDKTHNSEKDAKRDQMLESAGYRAIRFPSKKKPSESEISTLFSPSHVNEAELDKKDQF